MKTDLLRIAFADDDQDDHLFFSRAVHEVYQTALINIFFSSAELLEFYAGKRNVAPHIFFLDMNMAGNEDFQCVTSIRNDKSLSALPVIIYSTSAEPEHIEAALKAGANAFITKPQGVKETIQVLRQTIDQYTGMKFREKSIPS